MRVTEIHTNVMFTNVNVLLFLLSLQTSTSRRHRNNRSKIENGRLVSALYAR